MVADGCSSSGVGLQDDFRTVLAPVGKRLEVGLRAYGKSVTGS